MTDTYEYSPGPSIFMSGHSDWIIRRTGKPGIIASIIGHEDHAKAAVHALNQAAAHDTRTTDALRRDADRLAAALHLAVHDAHPMYGSTAGWRNGIGGQAITPGCSFIDPPPALQWLNTDALLNVLRVYHQRWGTDLTAGVEALTNELKTQHNPPHNPHHRGTHPT